MVQRRVFGGLRVGVQVMLLFALLLIAVPTTLAAKLYAPARATFLGPKGYYLALGDSLAFGYQPDLNWGAGYSSDFYTNLQTHGATHYDNLACPGETTTTFINGGCPYPYLRKYPYVSSQLQAALSYLHQHAGQVSPVTLDIGVNDFLPDFDTKDCSVNANWQKTLAEVDHNLTAVILPQLVAALTVNGQMTGDLLLMDYYDPYQNLCPNTVAAMQTLNAHLAVDAHSFATLVDIFAPFGGAVTPDPDLCNDTWICSSFKDIHAQSAGYSVMADAFEQTTGY